MARKENIEFQVFQESNNAFFKDIPGAIFVCKHYIISISPSGSHSSFIRLDAFHSKRQTRDELLQNGP